MKIAPTCVNTDGSAVNSKTCSCGSSECDDTKGLFCLATSSKCNTIMFCSKRFGSTINSESCSCGSSECDATKGLFCLATSSRCTIFAVGTCVGCEDLVGAKSGIAWEDNSQDRCEDYAANKGEDNEEGEDNKKNCANKEAVDAEEGAANDKW